MMDTSRIAIIGGDGRLGSWFGRFFSERGFSVSSVDAGDTRAREEIASDYSVLVFAVPHRVAPAVLQEWREVVTAEHLSIDLSSVKTHVAAALALSQGEHLLIHPMWSPQVPTMAGQTMVVCREGELGAKSQKMITLFEREGVRLTYLTAVEHDRIMATIQVASHAALLAIGIAHEQSGFAAADLSAVESPIYRMISAMIGRMLSHQSELYADIAMENPFGAEAIGVVRRAIESVEQAAAKGDRGEYVKLLEGVRHHRMGEVEDAVSDSGIMIEALARVRSGVKP